MIKKIFILIPLLFLSCSKKDNAPIYSTLSYDRSQLNSLIISQLKVAPILADSEYQLLTESFLQIFYKKYEKELFDKNVINWQESFDCNRFTLYFQALAQIAYYQDGYNKNLAESIAVGEVYYISQKRGAHAINLIILPNRIVFFEPQTGKEIFLTREEIDSIYFVKL